MSRIRFNASNCAAIIVVTAILLAALPASSYLDELVKTNTGVVPSHWAGFTSNAVQWNLSTAPSNNIIGSRTVEQVMQDSFSTWNNAPNSAVQVSEGPKNSITSEKTLHPGINLICFVCMDADLSKDSGTLAVTITTTDNNTGLITQSDIVFNSDPTKVMFCTEANGNCGPNITNEQDLQTVATHEIGHFLGLDHSGVVRAMMFPFAPPLLHTLSYDDVAGISTLYPKTSPDFSFGIISGTIHFASSGAPVFGAHVYASSTTGDLSISPGCDSSNLPNCIRKTPIGTLTRPDGTYQIQGLPPDSYTITAEPLDGPENPGDVSNATDVFGAGPVQTNFTTRTH